MKGTFLGKPRTYYILVKIMVFYTISDPPNLMNPNVLMRQAACGKTVKIGRGLLKRGLPCLRGLWLGWFGSLPPWFLFAVAGCLHLWCGLGALASRRHGVVCSRWAFALGVHGVLSLWAAAAAAAVVATPSLCAVYLGAVQIKVQQLLDNTWMFSVIRLWFWFFMISKHLNLWSYIYVPPPWSFIGDFDFQRTRDTLLAQWKLFTLEPSGYPLVN